MKKIIFAVVLFLAGQLSFAQTIQEAKTLTDNEQYEAASAMYQSMISQKPNDATLYYYLGDNLLSSDNPDSAKIIFDKGRTIDPQNAFIKVGDAKYLLSLYNLNQVKDAGAKDSNNPENRIRLEEATANQANANKFISEAIATPTKDPSILIEAAEACIHYKTKNLDLANTLLDKAAGLDQKNVEINLLSGDLYAELNNGTLAAEYYNKALELNKASARGIVSKGRLYKRSTNYQGAAEEFERAISVEPNYAPAHRELAEVYFKLNKLTQAQDSYRKYLELSKNNCGARLRFATFLYYAKNYKEAANELNTVAQRCDTNNLTLLRLKSYCFYQTKEYPKGLQAIERLFQLVPQDKRVSMDYEFYGKLLMATDQDSLGMVQLLTAYSLEPTKTELLSDIANGYMELKQYPSAISTFNNKMTLTGKDLNAQDYRNLGQAYYYNREFVLADSAFSKASQKSPKWISPYLWRAQANSQIDSTSELGLAKPFYEEFIRLALEDSSKTSLYQKSLADAYGYLAYFYILKKDDALALEFLKRKLELPLDPEDKANVQKGIDQLEKKKK